MCTALMINKNKCLFGRNMDLNENFNEQIIKLDNKIIGMGTYIDGIPLFADGLNKDGLAICGLNFKGYACFPNTNFGIPAWDFTRWVLLNFSTVQDFKKNIRSVIINSMPVNKDTPIPTLHWMIGDKNGECTVIESTKDGVFIYDNPAFVLTNNPTFPEHLENLNKYSFKKFENLPDGSPSLLIPGDYSSVSRFIKTAYLRKNLPDFKTEKEEINHFFGILDSVKMVDGTVRGGMHTIYSSCMDLKKGVYYYKRNIRETKIEYI